MVVTESRCLKDHWGLRQGAGNVGEWKEIVKQWRTKRETTGKRREKWRGMHIGGMRDSKGLRQTGRE